MAPSALQPGTIDRLVFCAIATCTLPIREEDVGRRSHLAASTSPEQIQESLARLVARGLVTRTAVEKRDAEMPLLPPQTEIYYEAVGRGVYCGA